MKKAIISTAIIFLFIACQKTEKGNLIQGKIEKEQIAVVSKIPGKILKIWVKEGDLVQKGDTLAVLDIPEVDAKKSQAEGAVVSAKAQYKMAVKGATENQIKQLEAKRTGLKEQYEFAQKSIRRLTNMLKDSLISQQTYDETFAKYQGAQAQYNAVVAELDDAKKGARIEQQTMALGQQDRALGALQEVETANKERYIIAPQNMSIETITLNLGELALPGYTLFNGYIDNSIYFRFTIPENQLGEFKKGQEITVHVPYKKENIKGKISTIKQLGAYGNIATAYPDYEMQESLFEIKITPVNMEQTKDLITKTTVTLSH
ncbi:MULTISPECIES: HlyD family secretion protein [Flavobacterium]|mgnify:CR=1 FL=1|jgi:HlyD family secretion protein|uniref:HlyD family secretion protein n=1 Tax=Flavobacterium TaxID=237 RepID=UPI000349E147|nr:MULTISPECIES: efflux RND transporter periplasmic adaptor subunit [Flavobacterium]MDL2143620.1 efflux RND transporter periplasmic adaptor subunit [Flavobacterium tructae]URC12920.1 efflux RND transporter periplasmic adaptor subunit [Flavobacterium sp. B183]